MNSEKFSKRGRAHISRVQHIFFISSECPFHTLLHLALDISSIHHYLFFYDYKGQ